MIIKFIKYFKAKSLNHLILIFIIFGISGSLTLILSGINIFRLKEFFLIIENIFFSIVYCIFGTLFLSHFYSDAFDLYINGNGGFIGKYLDQTFLNTLILTNEIIFTTFLLFIGICLILL